jgi:hypothetical protein
MSASIIPYERNTLSACHRGWPRRIVYLPGSNNNYGVTGPSPQDYKGARSVCPAPAKHACQPCPTTGCEL